MLEKGKIDRVWNQIQECKDGVSNALKQLNATMSIISNRQLPGRTYRIALL